MNFKESIMPPLVLTIICCVVCGLLVTAYNATYVDNTGVMTDKLTAGCREVFGDGDYQMLITESGDGKKQPVTFGEKGVDSIITDSASKRCLIEVTQDGYSKGGLHILVGFDEEGKVAGISFISLGETPGLGTKVQNDSFRDQFIGFQSGDSTENIDAVTAATYSSNGMKAAVSKCADLYSLHKEEIFSGENK